jgi:hypothetical protein
VLVAPGSYAFAFVGYLAAKRRWQGWLRTHLTGQPNIPQYIDIGTQSILASGRRHGVLLMAWNHFVRKKLQEKLYKVNRWGYPFLKVFL